MNQRELSIWLKGLIVIFFLLGTAFFFVIVPLFGRQQMMNASGLSDLFWPGIGFLWLSAIPIYMILLTAWQIFSEIGRDNSYCPKNAARLKQISYLGLVESLLYMIALILLVVLGYGSSVYLMVCIFVVVVGVAFSVTAASLSHIVEKNCRARQQA